MIEEKEGATRKAMVASKGLSDTEVDYDEVGGGV